MKHFHVECVGNGHPNELNSLLAFPYRLWLGRRHLEEDEWEWGENVLQTSLNWRKSCEEREMLFTSDIASIILLSSLAKELKLKDINHLQLSFNSAELISLLFFRVALHAIAMRAIFGYNSWHMMKRRMQWVEVMKKYPVHREDCYLRYRVSEWQWKRVQGNLNFKLSYNFVFDHLGAITRCLMAD